MYCDTSTYAIDPEFAFYGPAGFDTGAVIGNLLLNYVSQPGHSNNAEAYGAWVLGQIIVFYNTFVMEFLKQWNDTAQHVGYLYSRDTLLSPVEIKACQQSYTKQLLADTIGFAGMKMLRRIVGIAHVEDLESIAEAKTRSECENTVFVLPKRLLNHQQHPTKRLRMSSSM